MILKESKLLQESIEQYLIVESRQILLENIKNNPKKYFIINEDYKQYYSKEDWKVIEEGIWDTITGVASSVGDYFKENPRQGIQSIADVVSIFDPTGIVDLINGIFYYIFKDYFSAFFSFLGAALTMGGLLLTATGAGAVAGVPMEVAGKAVQTTKVAIKAGKITNVSVKEIGIAAKIAAPAIKRVAMIVEKVPLVKGVGKWLTKSADNVANVAVKEGATIDDVSKAVGSTNTEMANNPVVKSFTSKVVDAVKKQNLKPSVLQTGFAGLSTYGTWLSIDDYSLQKVALAQLQESFEKEGLKFDQNSEIIKKYLPEVIQDIKQERDKCRETGPDACKSSFEKFAENYPKTANLVSSLGKTIAQGIYDFGKKGADVLSKTDIRSN